MHVRTVISKDWLLTRMHTYYIAYQLNYSKNELRRLWIRYNFTAINAACSVQRRHLQLKVLI